MVTCGSIHTAINSNSLTHTFPPWKSSCLHNQPLFAKKQIDIFLSPLRPLYFHAIHLHMHYNDGVQRVFIMYKETYDYTPP